MSPSVSRSVFPPVSRRRRTARALAVAGCGALALLATACSSGSQARSVRGVVPWTDEPAAVAQLAQSTTPPACRVPALDLPHGQQAWGGAWHDAVSGYFVIENAGRVACTLAAPSRVTALVPSGRRSFDARRLAGTAVVLDPGDHVQVQLSAPYGCGRHLVESTGLTLALSTGVLRVPHARMPVQCGGELADFSARDTATAAMPPAAQLHVELARVPTRAGPGEALSYTVTLTNPTGQRIRFDQCPSYEEGLKGQPASVHSYQLNCGAVHGIGPHRSVTFAMQLPLPDHAARGPAVLDWHLHVPAGAVTQAQFASAPTQVG